MAVINIPGLFKTVTDAVSSVFASREEDPFEVYFDFGHYIEVVKNLTNKDKSISKKGSKYPLIWLVMDFPEKYGSQINGYCLLPRIDILIAMPTSPSISTSQRIDKNFLPRLYPIYQELLKQIASSSLFVEQSIRELVHEKIDRPYWGLQDVIGNGDKNLFNDFIDAVQIRGLSLTVNPAKCVA
jgi:hypothetical protein